MRALAEKLSGLERSIADEKGAFNLFALFLREDAPDVWDLVVAAEWIEEDEAHALVELAKRVRAYLRPDEITRISRVVIVESADPALKEIASVVSTAHGIAEVTNRNFFGLAIKRGFIITAQLGPPPNKVLRRPAAAAGGRR